MVASAAKARALGARRRAAGYACALLIAGSGQAQQSASSAPEHAAPTALAKSGVSAAGVNLNVTPRRVTLNRSTRTATIYVFNQGTTTTSFDVSLVDRVMTDDGQIRSVEEAGRTEDGKRVVARLRSAHDFVVAVPRRITLAPGRGQAVRVRALAPDDGAGGNGEYRTHLTVTNIPPPDTGLTVEEVASQKPNGISFRVRSVVAISIPVIVRTGPIDARAALDHAALTQAEAPPEAGSSARSLPAVTIDIVRAGASSLFGNVEIRTEGKGGEVLGTARGVGVYPEIERRPLQILLRRAPHSGERLTITYSDDDGHPGTELARTSLVAP